MRLNHFASLRKLMRSVRRATWTRDEPVSVSCDLYFSSVGALSKAMILDYPERGKVVEPHNLAILVADVKGVSACLSIQSCLIRQCQACDERERSAVC